MKLTLDRMCIQTGKLCGSCQEKYENREISDIDIDVGKVLMNIAKSQKVLGDITLLNIIETKNKIFLVVKKGDKSKFTKSGSVLTNQLNAVDKREFIVIEIAKKVKQIIEKLIESEYLISTSTVFLPPFSDKELKIKIKKEARNHLSLTSEDLSEITTALFGMNAHYAYI